MSSNSTYTRNIRGGSVFNAAPAAGGNVGQDKETLFAHKARKYHYKIQKVLKERVAKGDNVPAGYEVYLEEFKA